MITPAPHTPAPSIDAATQPGLLSLTVADLARSLAFYTQAIGLTVLEQDAARATLGVAGTPLLLLTEQQGARPWPRDRASYTGLYHFAILLPERADLGRWLRHWLELGLPLPGQGDHLVSEALYLSDPDENGIEIYRDRPRSEWQWVQGQVRMAADPVDIQGLLAEAERAGEPWIGMPAGTRLGHMHLQVGDIAQAARFYHEILGFDIVAHMPTALFVSAGGYHHHIGMNTWHSRGAEPAPAGTAGLRFFTIDLPTEEARQAVIDRIAAAGIPYTQTADRVLVQDPWQNTIALQVGATAGARSAAALEATVAERRTAVRNN
ncbi:MAG TPA: VOC family protein [Chloroflexota bacterium]|jgi:catechol 2,3-dioxygenase|nr:VOC family protein [Chloroflexota bacterium]